MRKQSMVSFDNWNLSIQNIRSKCFLLLKLFVLYDVHVFDYSLDMYCLLTKIALLNMTKSFNYSYPMLSLIVVNEVNSANQSRQTI
jgi:hypothetical protein